MFPAHSFLCLGLALLLPPGSLQSCVTGTKAECQKAPFAPGTNLAGEGFDITQMKRKGAFVIDMSEWENKDKTCRLCANPFAQGKKQKLPSAVLDWRPSQTCSMRVSSKLHRTSESLVSSLTSSVNNNWKSSLDVNTGKYSGSLMMAGTHSNMADYSMEKTKSDKYTFTSQSVGCQFYSYRLSGRPKLQGEFKDALKRLPKIYNLQTKEGFYKLIDEYGTHYITKVSLGGSVQSVTSIRQCQASLKGLSSEDVQMCLEVEAAASIGVASGRAEAKHCQSDVKKSDSKSSFSSLFNDRFTEIKGGHSTEPELLFSADKDPSAYKAWLTSVPQSPDIVSYSLNALHELLPDNTPLRKNLRAAVSHYILERALMKNCSNPCKEGRHGDSRDACVCQCHNNADVNADCCPTRAGGARVVVTVQRGSGLWGDHTTATDGYVKVSFGGKMIQRTRVINNDNNPHWNAKMDLGNQYLSQIQKLRLEVWDEDNKWDDDLLGECERELSAGVRVDVCDLQHGRLYFKWEVTCVPSLGGPRCNEYKPSPMNSLLRQTYVSRHSHPIPKSILASSGVFLGTSAAVGNHNRTLGGA